jgi:O-antigen ligase
MSATLIGILLLAFALLAWRNPRAALFLLAASLPSYLLRFDVAGIPFTALEGMIVLLALAWFPHRKTFPIDWQALRPWRLPILLLLLAASVSVLASPHILEALGILKAYYLEPALLFVVATAILKTRDDQRKLLTAFAISAAFVAAAGLAQYLFDAGIPAPWDVERRITSVYPYPNAVGLFLAPILVACVAMGVLTGSRARIAWFAAAIVSVLAILAAKTEAALVAIDATLGLSGLAYRPTRRAVATLAFFGVLAVLVSPWRGVVFEKLALHDRSGEVRRTQWTETAAFLKDHPLQGAGLSGYPTAFAPYHLRTDIEIFQYPHNLVLNAWVETGLLGLLALALLGFVAIRRAPRPSQWAERPEAAAATLALLAMCIHGLVDVPFYKNDLAALAALLLAILASYARPAVRP